MEKKINLSKAIVEGTLSVTNLVASTHVWTQYKIVSVKWYEVFIWFIFCKNLGNLPNAECLQMFRSPLGCSTATTLEYALAFYGSSKSSM